MRCFSVGPKHVVQLLDPALLGIAESLFESSEDHLVCGFGLSVGLGVLHRGEVLLGSEFGDEVLELSISELRPIIGY